MSASTTNPFPFPRISFTYLKKTVQAHTENAYEETRAENLLLNACIIAFALI
jgi:hypothetical protein